MSVIEKSSKLGLENKGKDKTKACFFFLPPALQASFLGIVSCNSRIRSRSPCCQQPCGLTFSSWMLCLFPRDVDLVKCIFLLTLSAQWSQVSLQPRSQILPFSRHLLPFPSVNCLPSCVNSLLPGSMLPNLVDLPIWLWDKAQDMSTCLSIIFCSPRLPLLTLTISLS